MSTRCNVVLRQDWEFTHSVTGETTKGTHSLIFYRHSDGYPDGVKESLDRFCKLIESGIARPNVGQAAGWLILIGHEEQRKSYERIARRNPELKNVGAGMDWKVGEYEPSDSFAGDMAHLYEVDVVNATWHEVSNRTGYVRRHLKRETKNNERQISLNYKY